MLRVSLAQRNYSFQVGWTTRAVSNFLHERELICEVGRRMYAREFVAAHEGNLSIRLPDGNILCTPTMHCKGFLAPDDLCVIDMEMNQIEGSKKPTSEIRLHLEIYRRRPDIRAVVHSHAPHATAFAVANYAFPCGVLAEPELFLGEVPLAPFAVPGTDEFASSVSPFVAKTNAILLANHGLVTYAEDLEKALWMTEILDSACKSVILSRSLGGPKALTMQQSRALVEARARYGFEDPRDLSDPDADPRSRLLFGDCLNDQ